MLGFIKKQSKLNKILILVAFIILILMIAAVITFYLFIDKKTVEVNIIPETNIPENTAGEPYLDKTIPGSATVEALPNSAEVPPSPLPAGPPAPNTSYNLTPNAYPVISPTSP